MPEDHSNCLHCHLVQALDAWNEHQHTSTGKPVHVDTAISALLQCVAELLAMYPDTKQRKFEVKRAADSLAVMVREARADGQYVGAPEPVGGMH